MVADVTLDPSRRTKVPLTDQGRWSVPGPPVREAVALVGRIGERAYALNWQRRRRARAASAGEPYLSRVIEREGRRGESL